MNHFWRRSTRCSRKDLLPIAGVNLRVAKTFAANDAEKCNGSGTEVLFLNDADRRNQAVIIINEFNCKAIHRKLFKNTIPRLLDFHISMAN